jgi:hypothetical protein
MNHYIMIRRLRAPAILLLAGVLALLHQTGLIAHPWHFFWALLLILIGVLKLAERATMAGGDYPPMPYPGAPYPGAPQPGAPSGSTGVPAYPGQPQAQYQSPHPQHSDDDSEGGRS